MKFENIKVGMKVQHKKSGKVHEVKDSRFKHGYHVGYYNDGQLDDRFLILDNDDAKLFRKYKEPQQ